MVLFDWLNSTSSVFAYCGQLVKNLQCRRSGFDLWVREDPLEKEMTTHSSTLAWRILWTEELGRFQFAESDMTVLLSLFLSRKKQSLYYFLFWAESFYSFTVNYDVSCRFSIVVLQLFE